MTENKTAKTPTDDGHVAWACQCGKLYTVTCISSKPSKQEPVAWISHIPTIKVNGKQLHWTKEQAYKWSSDITPLYVAPKQWVGLTDEERHSIREWQEIQKELGPVWAPMMLYLYLAIEQALKEKNT